jgi:hydroxymethylpyrimidine/phosphomethylpyrimidine kinase
MTVPVVLSIAGSDSGGGAGIQADLKTFAALGVHGATVITALTAQNSRGITGIHEVPPDFVGAQMDAVFSDFDVAAVKIGMLGNTAITEAVSAGLGRHKARNIVLDPVLVASTGADLLHADAMDALKKLFGFAALVTPNLFEAAALLDADLARDEAEMQAQGLALLAFGAGAVLVKGGHGGGSESVDILVEAGCCSRFAAPRHATKNTHGTGCTLASAIATGLAKGQSLADAVCQAKTYISAAIAGADRLKVGSGRGPVHHLPDRW